MPHFLNIFILAFWFCFFKICQLKGGVNTSGSTEAVNTVFKQISEKMGLLLTGIKQARGWYQSLPVDFVCVNSFLTGICIKIVL